MLAYRPVFMGAIAIFRECCRHRYDIVDAIEKEKIHKRTHYDFLLDLCFPKAVILNFNSHW